MNGSMPPRSVGGHPGRGKLVLLGESWGVRNARGIVDEVFDSVATWQVVFADAGVPADDCANFREMDTRLASTP